MRYFTVFFPERVVEGQALTACTCGMVACGSQAHTVQRGVRMEGIRGNSVKDVWDRMKRKHPFEKIEVWES